MGGWWPLGLRRSSGREATSGLGHAWAVCSPSPGRSWLGSSVVVEFRPEPVVNQRALVPPGRSAGLPDRYC